jgi:Tfp pilus assembly major pilin PilA
MLTSKRGQFSIGGIVAVVIGIIMLVALAVPVTQDVVASANLTGTTATIANLLPLLLIVGGVILVASLYTQQR